MPKITVAEEATLTRYEAAELADVDPRTIDRWAKDGLITKYKLGGLQWVRFKESEVRAMRRPAPAEQE